LLINPSGKQYLFLVRSIWRFSPGLLRSRARTEQPKDKLTSLPITQQRELETASLLELRAGDAATNINITMSAVEQRRIRGVILDGNRQPVQDTIVVYLHQTDRQPSLESASSAILPNNGKFAVHGGAVRNL
jgi:hypothetical protein